MEGPQKDHHPVPADRTTLPTGGRDPRPPPESMLAHGTAAAERGRTMRGRCMCEGAGATANSAQSARSSHVIRCVTRGQTPSIVYRPQYVVRHPLYRSLSTAIRHPSSNVCCTLVAVYRSPHTIRVHCPTFAIHRPQNVVRRPPSAVHRPLSNFPQLNRPLSIIHCPLSTPPPPISTGWLVKVTSSQ